MSERLVVTAFIEGNDGKKRPQRIGTIVMKSPDKGNLYLTAVPVGKWDGSAAIELPRDDQGQSRLSTPRARAPAGARPAFGGGDDANVAPEDDSDIPFVSQRDMVRSWLR